MTAPKAVGETPAEIVIRDATAGDLQAINDIYNWYVGNCTCTWQMEKETMDSRRAWFAAHGVNAPVLVAERGGEIIAWASLSRFHPHEEGCERTLEDSIYVRPDAQKMGLGTRLLAALVARAADAGCHTVIASISGDQEGSIALHRKFGFTEVGRLRQAGKKFGKWLDWVYMQKMIEP